MKIAHILDSTTKGGVQVVVYQRCTQVTDHEHTVISLGSKGKTSEEFEKADTQVIESNI